MGRIKLILEFFSTCRFADDVLDLDAGGTLQFLLGGIDADSSRVIASKADLRDYWSGISSLGQAPKNVTTTNLYFLGAWMRGRLLTEDSLRGLTVVVHDPTKIDMDELVRLRICERLLEIPNWVAPRPEMQQVDPAPIQIPEAPPAAQAPMTML
ncbi:hypothetical protein Tco_0186113 [Tanacetum coccineum]